MIELPPGEGVSANIHIAKRRRKSKPPQKGIRSAMNQIAAASSVVSGRATAGRFNAADVGGSEETACSTEFIGFAIGNKQYGIDIMTVREIAGWSNTAPCPGQPDYVCGVLNLPGLPADRVLSTSSRSGAVAWPLSRNGRRSRIGKPGPCNHRG